ncbi:MAG: hypothetical protein C0473_02275 [Cyanobacteria bacterium DS3.002]|nr:hypothetical protein [Cyanobacteria bacterium DS3.002]MBA4049639.1 hypothetical protein [Cyanobacteria bacterium DS2.008]MBA4073396.1 hypothetical protein [Cyanobacteria bacterium PR.023]
MSQFLSLFHRYGYIYKPIAGGNWSSANETWKLDDSSILKAISLQNNKYYIGSRSGKKTLYAVLDIDADSKYHCKEELDRLLEALDLAGLKRSSLYRSSFSGGWHLYIFFDEPINSKNLYQLLVKLLKLSDFEVAKGTLEVFPHPGYASLGMGLRLPLQAGFAWLDKTTLDVDHYREEMSATKALEFFIDCLDSDTNSYADFLALKARVIELEAIQAAAPTLEKRDNIIPIRSGKPVSATEHSLFLVSIFGHVPLNIDAEVWQRGRQFHLLGLTNHSQRAEAAFCLGHYFFYGDPSRGLPALGYTESANREQLIQDFLSSNHNGFSKDIARGRTDATAQVTRMANWVPPHRRDGEVEHYTATAPISWIRENAKRKANARRRIEDALMALQVHKRPFSTVELQKKAGCARDTLYKHADIWRQEYENLAEGFFTACPDEYNAVEDFKSVEEGSPCSSFPSVVSSLDSLALRQISFESPLLVCNDNVVSLFDHSGYFVESSKFVPYTSKSPFSGFAMADEVEKKTEAPQAPRSFEEIVRASQFTDRSKLETWSEATADYRATQKDSATMEALSDEKIAEIKANGGFQKFELFESKAPKSRETFVDPHPSFVEGLKAVGDDEEAQGRFSIEYMERKAQEALGIAQKPTEEQILLASNIFSGAPNIEQIQEYPDIQSDSEKLQPDAIVARDWGATLKKGLDRTLQTAQHPDLIHWENPLEGGDQVYPRRGREDEFIDYDACAKANKAFPELAEYIGSGPRQVDPDLIAATIRNEQYYFDNRKDAGPENYVQKHHSWPFNQDESLGPAQMQVQNMEHLTTAYPKQLGIVSDAVKNGTDVHRAPYYVGAYFADVVHGIESKQKPDYIAENIWKQVNERWQKGQHNEALIIAYNPDPNQINHVFTQLDNIKAPDWD